MSDDDTTREAGDARLDAISSQLGIGNLTRHIFLCAQQTNPLCSSYEESGEVWRHLKRRLKQLDLASAPPKWRSTDVHLPPPEAPRPGGTILRTKVDCFRICEQGPVAVVYPDGVWYRGVTIEVLDRIIDEHLVGGRKVEEFVFASDEMGN